MSHTALAWPRALVGDRVRSTIDDHPHCGQARSPSLTGIAGFAVRDFVRKILNGAGGVGSVGAAEWLTAAFACQISGAGALSQHQVGALVGEMADFSFH